MYENFEFYDALEYNGDLTSIFEEKLKILKIHKFYFYIAYFFIEVMFKNIDV